MATLRNKRKLAAMARETQNYPRNNQSQNSAAPGTTEDYITRVSEEIEGRVTKKLSQEFSWTELTVEFLLKPQIRTCFVAVPGTLRNADVENQEPSGSQNDPHPEVEFSACRVSNLTDSDLDNTSHSSVTLMNRLEVILFDKRTEEDEIFSRRGSKVTLLIRGYQYY